MQNIAQNNFLESNQVVDTASRENAGRNLARKISQIRNNLSPSEKEFDSYLANIIKEIKYQASLSDEKRRDLVLFCIEESHAHTWFEIEDDSHLSQSVIREILSELIDKKLIETRQRYTVGGSANQTLIFSKRKPCTCV